MIKFEVIFCVSDLPVYGNVPKSTLFDHELCTTMASQLPAFPRTVFTIIEPISLIAGWVAPFVSPDWFIDEQFPFTKSGEYTDNARLVALQLGNAYGLLFMVGVAVLYTTTELKVVRNYLWALWLADIGHIGITAYFLGYEKFLAVSEWNAMTMGNIGATGFLCLTRTAYLFGLFGRDGGTRSTSKKLA